MNNLQKYLSTCLIATAALVVGASPAWAQVSLGAASGFSVLGGTAVTCTTSVITGDVGVSPGTALTNTGCTIAGTTHQNDQAAIDANAAFFSAYAALKNNTNNTPCGQVLPTLDINQTLSPGVYCFDAAAVSTGHVLTLNGPSNGVWIFKIGTKGTGALTGTGFSVVMTGGGQPCNVFWWVAEATTMTDSHFIGTILAGAAITMTSGTNTLAGRALAKAAVTMTNASVIGCSALSGTSSGKGKGCDGDDNEKDKEHSKDKDKDKEHRSGNPFGSDDDHGRKGGDR